MRIQDLVAAQLAGNGAMLESTLADFSDADMLVRPVPAANHAAWQVAHLVMSETMFIKEAGGKGVELPAGFSEKMFAAEGGEKFPPLVASKAQLLELWKAVRGASVAWAKSLADADLDKPSPEMIRSWVPTLAEMGVGMVVHATMHVGQMQVIRRKLGKPILF